MELNKNLKAGKSVFEMRRDNEGKCEVEVRRDNEGNCEVEVMRDKMVTCLRMKFEKNMMIMYLLKCLKVFENNLKGNGKLVIMVVVFNNSYIVDDKINNIKSKLI